MEKIFLIGCGQHSNVVRYNMMAQGKYEAIGFLDGDDSKVGQSFNGLKVIGNYKKIDLKALFEEYKTNKFFISFGNMKFRKNVFNQFIEAGGEAVNIFHPNAIISPDAKIGKGVLIECGCLITPNPVIGDNVVVNTGSQVNHDNLVENHVYIASGVVLSGGVKIGENTLLDDGVIVTLGRTVGKNCIVGAGAIVTKTIEDNVVAYGIPAKPIRENITE